MHPRTHAPSTQAPQHPSTQAPHYAACVDEAAIDALGIAPLRSELARIAAVKTVTNSWLIAHLHRLVGETAAPGSPRRSGQYVFFTFGARPQFDDATIEMAAIGSDGLTLPGRDYYTGTDDRSVAQRHRYREHVARMLQLVGDSTDESAKGAESVLTIESRLATVTYRYGPPPGSERDPSSRHARSAAGSDACLQLAAGDTPINGRLTLGENTADNAGLRLALMASLAGPGAGDAAPQPAVDGLSATQRVFLGWAQQRCETSRPDAERLKAATNSHSANICA